MFGKSGVNSKFFEQAQRFGKSFMLPIAVLPAAGLLLGIGGALSNPNTLQAYPFLNVAWLQWLFTIMSSAGVVAFANLAVIFAIGVAVGLAKSDKGTAGLAAVLAYLIMNSTINALLKLTHTLVSDGMGAAGQGMILGTQSLETGVFGGVVIGIMTSWLHNKYNKVNLPQFLGFFSGSRFIPIICSFAAIFVGGVMFVFWPFAQKAIMHMGGIVDSTGYIGTFVYGFFLRMLGPFGLHHIFYMPFWTTALGGSLVVDGQLVEGTQRIFFAQLADVHTTKFYIGTSRFMSGRFITMMFGLIGATLALYRCAKVENRPKIKGFLLSAALTSFLTGITEPIEFSFLFVAPMLYVLHAVFDGLAFMIAHILQITIGQTFSGGFIDFILFGILQGNAKTNWVLVPVVGVFWFFVYYFSFTFLIKRFNILTIGRDDENSSVEAENNGEIAQKGEKPLLANQSKSEKAEEQAENVIKALGGKVNIKELDCCATRLRVTVADENAVDQSALKSTGAKGVIAKGKGIQVIYGPHVTVLKNIIEEILEA